MDDDDLFGGGPAAPAASHADPFGDDDDLFGGGPSKGPALDDDLLFGGPATSAPAASSAAAAAAPAAPSAPMSQRRAIPVGALKETSPSLATFLTPSTFFLRFCMIIDADGKRSRRVLTVSDAKIYILRENTTIERDIPVTATIGVLVQNLQVTKRMGSKENELHVFIQFGGGETDLTLSLHKDDGNFTGGTQGDFTSVLSAVLSAYDVVLPVAMLPPSEKLSDYARTSHSDDKIRKQVCEALAYRSELFREQQELAAREQQLEISIAQLRGSQAGQAASDMLEEIRSLEGVIAEFNPKMSQLSKDRMAAMKQLDAVNVALQDEAHRRNEQLRQMKEEVSKKHLLAQVKEYELQKAAHKREMDKINQLSAIYDRRVKERGSGSFNVSQLALRIDDLEEQLASIKSKISERSDEHSRRVKILAENKRRTATAKDLLAHIPTEIALLTSLSPTEPVPSGVADTTLPDTSPLTFNATAEGGATAAPAAAQPAAAPPAAKATASTAAAPDGGVSPDLPPVKPPAAAKPPPPVSLDDDI